MTSVRETLQQLTEKNNSALIGFWPVGFPTLEKSIEIVETMIESGVDIIEFGLPYSDPVLDGSTIQVASAKSLENGTRLVDTFTAVSAVSARVPTLVMTYFNPVYKYGVEKFAAELKAAGGAGLITADLIPESAADWIEAADKHDLDKVFLVAPSSKPERIALTAKASRGFVYAASVMGVTGARTAVGNHAQELVQNTKDAGAEFVCLGLGVSTAEQAKEVASYADGVIVGSAFVKIFLTDQPYQEQLAALTELVSSMAAATKPN